MALEVRPKSPGREQQDVCELLKGRVAKFGVAKSLAEVEDWMLDFLLFAYKY